jgi:outer membrane protein TolC
MKRLAVTIIAAAILLTPLNALAETDMVLTLGRAEAFMNVNSVVLKKLARAERDAYRQYDSYIKEAEGIDTQGFTYSFGGRDYYIDYDLETKTMMTKMKELVPEQMKFAWESARDNRAITGNSLKISLRSVYFGLYSARAEFLLKQKHLELAADMNSQDKIKLERGLISALEMQESEYNLLKARKDADIARRNYDNMARNFNQFTGLPADMRFGEIMFEEKPVRTELEPVDYYVEQALSNRYDIKSIEKQIALKENEKSIIESNHFYKISTTAQDEHKRLLIDLEQLGLDLEGMRLSVALEIKNAYVDIVNTGKSVENLKKTLELQRSSFAKTQARYNAGQVSGNILKQAEIGLLQVENAYKAALFDYNTKIMRFDYATGVGPGY